jgi:diguanylate cyclase (GGDEF)-like protein
MVSEASTSSSDRDPSPDHGWLCPTDAHRDRMLDMNPRVRRARAIAMGAMGLAMVAASPMVGWVTAPMFAVAIVAMATLDRRTAGKARPERVIARTFVLMIVLTGVAAALTGGPHSPVLPLLAIPVGLASARFRGAVVWAGAALASVVAVAACLSAGVGHAAEDPLMLLSVLVLLVAVAATTTALTDAEFQFRSQSVLDPLTGMLNRGGLEVRFAEVAAQARYVDRPVCLILCDLDHFKQVNDRHGHDHGDTVLKDVSYALRKSLRSFELFYRVGGEEFLVVMPGVDLAAGVAFAECMREVVENSNPGGLPVTASFGVSVGMGDEIEFRPLYRAADEELYRSKAAGRNRVSAGGTTFAAASKTVALA